MMPYDVLQWFTCDAGFTCEAQEVQCLIEPCDPVPVCVAGKLLLNLFNDGVRLVPNVVVFK